MNASESYLVPNTRAKANETNMDESLLDDHKDGLENANLSFNDVSFNLGTEMDISMIAKDSPKNESTKGGEKQEETKELNLGHQDNDKDMDQNMSKIKTDVSLTSYADMVQKKTKEAAEKIPTGKENGVKNSKYSFTAEELL